MWSNFRTRVPSNPPPSKKILSTYSPDLNALICLTVNTQVKRECPEIKVIKDSTVSLLGIAASADLQRKYYREDENGGGTKLNQMILHREVSRQSFVSPSE